MRHVKYDHTKIKYPDGWETDAKTAFESVEAVAGDDDARADEVNKHREVWKRLKPELAKLMNHKCWYTESPQAGTDTDVDHFRPKNAVKGAIKSGTKEKHPGYWWRAFDPSNFRYSCIIANRLRRDIETGFVGGKADEFPIWDEAHRSWCQADDCDSEQPMLLDPCKATDVALITFAENGEAIERYSKAEKPRLYKRAKISKKLYHLNHTDFVNARIAIRDQIEKLLDDARRYYKRLNEADAHLEHAYERTIEQLRDLCSLNAPYSSFAIVMLEKHKLEDCIEPVFRK